MQGCIPDLGQLARRYGGANARRSLSAHLSRRSKPARPRARPSDRLSSTSFVFRNQGLTVRQLTSTERSNFARHDVAARCPASSAAAIGLAVPAAAITRSQVRQLVPLGLGRFMLQARVLCRLCLPCDKPGGMLGVVRWTLQRPEVCDMQSVQRAQGVRPCRQSRRGNRGLRAVVLHVLFV